MLSRQPAKLPQQAERTAFPTGQADVRSDSVPRPLRRRTRGTARVMARQAFFLLPVSALHHQVVPTVDQQLRRQQGHGRRRTVWTLERVLTSKSAVSQERTRLMMVRQPVKNGRSRWPVHCFSTSQYQNLPQGHPRTPDRAVASARMARPAAQTAADHSTPRRTDVLKPASTPPGCQPTPTSGCGRGLRRQRTPGGNYAGALTSARRLTRWPRARRRSLAAYLAESSCTTGEPPRSPRPGWTDLRDHFSCIYKLGLPGYRFRTWSAGGHYLCSVYIFPSGCVPCRSGEVS